MATITSFEEIQSWQKARELTKVIYKTTRAKEFSDDYDLKKQIRRASVSIMANIAEGFERGGTNEFVNFISIAKGSSGEMQSHLYVALDQEYITQDVFDKLYNEYKSVGKMLGSFMNYLNKSDFKGAKFQNRTTKK